MNEINLFEERLSIKCDDLEESKEATYRSIALLEFEINKLIKKVNELEERLNECSNVNR